MYKKIYLCREKEKKNVTQTTLSTANGRTYLFSIPYNVVLYIKTKTP